MEEELVEQLGGALRRLAQVRQSLPMGGLPMGEYWMLQLVQRRLAEQPEAGGVYVSALMECTHASPPAVSRTLRKLEEKELLQRRTNPRDRRTTYVVLTESGQHLLEASRRQMEELAQRVAQRMGEDALRALTVQLDQLTETVLEERDKMPLE